MHDFSSVTRVGLAMAALAGAAGMPIDTTAAQTVVTAVAGRDDGNTQGNTVASMDTPTSDPIQDESTSGFRRGTVLTAPSFAPLFATAEDALAFWHMLDRTYRSPMPDPRTVAKAFIKERLGIDGDKYVVAHFATAQERMEGSADSRMTLTDALMRAFPEHSRHAFFGTLADTVEGLNVGGRRSPGAFGFVESVATCQKAGECFSRIGRFLWSRTGPGYIYNTFIGTGSVLEVATEDLRPLDEAFGIYPKSSTFTPEHLSHIRLSEVIGKFKEEGAFSELPYVSQLKAKFDNYWAAARSEWPQIARYRFVHEARRARTNGTLTQPQYELVMKGGAPLVPLNGSIALWQLRDSPPAPPVTTRRFDINGYAASDIVRFVAADGGGVLYIPGAHSPFVVFASEAELRAWVVRQARDRDALDDLLSHFSIYNRQDGQFWTGVAQGLANLASGRWDADDRSIDASGEIIRGDVFAYVREQMEARVRDDARMRISTAWDAWRVALNRTNAVLGPLGYAPPLAVPVQAGSALLGFSTGIDEGIHGKTTEERKHALEQAVMTVVTSATVATTMGAPERPAMRTVERAPAIYVPSGGTPSVRPGTLRTASETASGASSSMSTEILVAYSLGAIAPPRLQPRVVPGRTATAPVTESGSGPLPRGDEGAVRVRQFDPQGVDPRTPFNLLAVEREAHRRGYLVQTIPRSVDEWTRRVIDLKKTQIDEARHRLDDFRAESLRTNLSGYRVSLGHSLVYRVDARKPVDLVRDGGFGPSVEFNDIVPMLRQRSTIGSGSLHASNIVFASWQEGQANLPSAPAFNQYAVWTEGRTVASASDNHDPMLHDYMLDEVHFPADVAPRDIYIIDSFDPLIARALANIYESRFVSTPYGVPLDAFREYFAGRLNIDAPNRFSQPSTSPRASSTITSDSQQLFMR